MVNGSTGSPPIQADDPAAAPSPPRTPWTPGVASADCESQVGGTKTQLVNAVIDGAQVWVTGWQSGSKALLCVRAEQGSTQEGGRFTIDATNSPGVQPVVEVGNDTTGCTRGVFSNDTVPLNVQRSDPTNPASVCVTRGTTTTRLTLGFTGAVNDPEVSFTPDG